MALIPTEILDDIRLQNDIVNVIGEYVRLEKKGRNYVGACPFHQERDPSFSVSPEKQIFYCFGCQTGGNLFKFLMLVENLTFIESVSKLAARAGIVLPDIGKALDKRQVQKEERAWQANALARDYYHHYLLKSPEAASAREYLAGRGMSDEIIKIFRIGYAPAAWDSLIGFLNKRNYHKQELVDIGLVVGSANRFFDRFRNRIIFPVSNHLGKVVAFGGRILESADGNGSNQPKYLNTPETAFFHKSKVLYGLDVARKHIKESGFIVLMEGYMDVITAHQFGIRNAVASMGTSLTPEQGKTLMRYAKDVYIAYDADSAGQRAAVRGLDILQETGCCLKVINMPEGADPDDFIRQQGIEEWDKLVKGAQSLLEYKIKIAQKDSTSPSEILNTVVANLAAIKNRVDLEESIRLVASMLNISWESIKGEIRRFQLEQRKKRVKTDKIAKNKNNIILQRDREKNAVILAEQEILRILIQDPSQIDYFYSQLGNDFIQYPVNRELYQFIVKWAKQGDYDYGKMMDELEGSVAALFSKMVMESELAQEKETDIALMLNHDGERAIDDYIKVIKKNLQAKKRMTLMQELAEAEKNNNLELVKDILIKLQNL